MLVVATANPDADRAALEDALQTALRLTPAPGAASAWRFERADALTSNPWAATTLEWQTPSPPPHGNFLSPPEVHRGPYEYSVPGAATDFTPQNQRP